MISLNIITDDIFIRRSLYTVISFYNKTIKHNNILGKFETYVYTKPNFDPAPRLFKEFQWLGKDVIYSRDKNIKDGGMVYWDRPIPTKRMYYANINILVGLLERIELWRTPQNG